jgi:hypothetical protein
MPLLPYQNGCGCGGLGIIPPVGRIGNECILPTRPEQESVASQLTNLETALFGSFQTTVVNGRATWSQLCSLSSEVPGYPINSGEGFICYLIRIIAALSSQISNDSVQTTPFATSVATAKTLTSSDLASGNVVCVLNAINPGQLSFYLFSISGSRPAESIPAIFYPDDNPQGFFTLVD